MKSQQSPQRSSNNRSNNVQQSDEDDSESDDVVYQRGAVLNLLDIGNSSRWKEDGRISLSNLGGMNLSQLAQASTAIVDGGDRNGHSGLQQYDGSVDNSDRAGEMSITKVFEPKFMEVFNKYLESASKVPDLSKHLLSVCLENLIEFSCWSRENASQSQWIRSILDENSDLRPEVRNGLAMILIYVFSSAQASQQNSDEINMFTVLQDAEKGMGIVNKTSLKIYNDPFNYFNFLKSCISGLIDAGKIPENERQNQPKKPKRVNENKEEVAAFEHLHQAVVKWIDEGDHVLVRSKIGQIMDVWQQKQKGIRNRRFAMALQLISTPATISVNPTFVAGNVGAVFSPRLYDASTSNGGFDMNGASSTNPLTSLAAIADIYDGDKRTSALAAANALLSSAGLDAASLAKAGEHPNAAQSLSNGAASNLNMLSLDPSLLSNPTLLAAAHLVQQHQQQQQQQKLSTSTPSASSTSRSNDHNNGNDSRSFHQPPAKYARTSANSAAGAAHSMNQLSSTSQDAIEPYRSKSASAVNNTTHPITVLRFERVSGRDWDYQELKVYNVEALLEHHRGPLWFINETKLSREECQLKHLQTPTHGMVSLSQELQQRQALVSSWLPKDHAHLTDFVSAWLQEQQRVGSGESREGGNKTSESESMLQFWRRQSMQQNGERSADEEETAAVAKGILAYEVVLQVGFVVRKDEALGIHEDCWRLVYPQELQQRLQQHQSSSFAQFLASLFPQLRSVLLQKRSDDDLAGTIVKYFPHHLEHPVQHPPKRDHQQGAGTTYQTIGTLAESVETIFTQFETSFVAFHDIVLQGTT